ncbi:MAG: amidohydrolase family protein, partial [Verrucomicrobiota bacterium]
PPPPARPRRPPPPPPPRGRGVGLAAMRRIDCHVHLVGDGSSGSGCWVRFRTLYHRFMGGVMLREHGMPRDLFRKGKVDEAYVERLVEMVEGSASLDAAVLLAQDIPYSDDGEPLPEKGGFHVPNDYLFEVVERHPDIFLAAASIHPGRPDAMEELERCIERGAPVLKLLPNCLNVNCSDKRYQRFWERMAEAGMIFLSHTGGELSLPVMRPEYADPAILRLPLECGVRVIAAHCAGRSGLWDPDYTAGLLKMFEEFPNLYGDNSALSTPIRSGTVPKVLAGGQAVMERILHGSDFPIPVGGFGPWRVGAIDRGTWRAASAEGNALERDCLLKRGMGFEEETFGRLARLMGERTS